MVEITVNEPNPLWRLVFFKLVGTDGITPATNEAGGQPQILINEGAWTNTGISVLTNPGGATVGANPNGLYYAVLDPSVLVNPKDRIETRYKSAGTAECPGDSMTVVAVDTVGELAILARLGITGLITVTSLVSGQSQIGPVYLGNDYKHVDGRSFDFASTGWPDLTGATSVYLFLPGSTGPQTFTMSFAMVGVGLQVIRWEPSVSDTNTLDACTPRKTWAISAVLADGHTVRLANPVMLTAK